MLRWNVINAGFVMSDLQQQYKQGNPEQLLFGVVQLILRFLKTLNLENERKYEKH
ncbi:MAG TPA: hypothetical protein VN456_14330 [Desulfosporosinus sp.]|nr:hypothetical protein [Desulfosporosinus sp.]